MMLSVDKIFGTGCIAHSRALYCALQSMPFYDAD